MTQSVAICLETTHVLAKLKHIITLQREGSLLPKEAFHLPSAYLKYNVSWSKSALPVRNSYWVPKRHEFADQNQSFLPQSKPKSQGRIWEVKIRYCLWLTMLNKKTVAFVQQPLQFSGFACLHHFLASGREIWIPSLPLIEPQSGLRLNRVILALSPSYFGIGVCCTE